MAVRQVLVEPSFVRLYACRITSQAADGAFQVALAAYVIFAPERQATAGQIAAAFATLLLPYSLVGPFAGVFIDRWSRQRILMVGNLLRAALVLAVAVLTLGGQAGPLFFVGALAVLSVNRFFLAALSAALPHVVPAAALVSANAVSTTSGTVAAVAGGGIGFAVRLLVGQGDRADTAVMVATAAGYLTSALIASRLGANRLGPDPDGERPSTTAAVAAVARGLARGIDHLRHRRQAGQALLAIAAHRFCYGITTVAVLLLYRNSFHADNALAGLGGLALVVAASGVGYVAAAVVTPIGSARYGERHWLVLALALGGAVQLLGAAYTQPAVLLAAALLGVSAQATKITVDTIVQQTVADAFRGRVFALYDLAFNVAFVLAAAVAAGTLPPSGRSYPVLAGVALTYGATAAAYGWRSSLLPAPEHRPTDAR